MDSIFAVANLFLHCMVNEAEMSGMHDDEKNWIVRNRRDRRSGFDRRRFSYADHIPERRIGQERRSGLDRRKGASSID